MNPPVFVLASFLPLRRGFSTFAAAACALAGAAVPASAQVTITPETDAVHVAIDGKPFTDFVLRGGNAMKPYLYPLRSATGKLVTRHFPMEKVDGEPTDHPHQRGLWFAHERVNGFDFWNNEADYKTPIRGRIVVTKISDVQNGPDSGSFKADLDWNDPEGKKVLSESRTTTFRKTPTLRIIDLDLTLTAPGEVTFGDSKDGAFGIRLAPALEEPDGGPAKSGNTIPGTGTIVSAEGETSKTVWGKLSNWVDYSGEVEGEKVGVTIFDHPENARRARWHVRNYGLFAANPFGLKVFTGDKTQDGSLVLKAGESLRLRYRVVIHPGDAKTTGIGQLWDEYVKAAK
ncbi:MAG TPA: PmoA family protein [Chthoniobacteraceae bacterium]|jgi:hypothetical protein|nr:PmoA family protein [Chthoniobacteraceae bacterium]